MPKFIIEPEHPVDFLLETVKAKFGLKTRRGCIEKIGSTIWQVSKIRHDYLDPSPEFILRAYDRTGISIEEIRKILQVGPI